VSFRLVDSNWEPELATALSADSSHVRIVCPFIKKGALGRLLKTAKPDRLQVVTRFNLIDCADGVSDLGALRLLLERGATVRGVRNLHTKLYVFGHRRAILTSANLTDAALRLNYELGCVAEDRDLVSGCISYFDSLWRRAGRDLTVATLNKWEERVSAYLASGCPPRRPSNLRDEGVDAGMSTDLPMPAAWAVEAPQFFVKFLGEGDNRVDLDSQTLNEIERAGCHWAVAYPASKRPTSVEDGAEIFIGRLTKDPNDIRVFGRAIAMRYVPGRDDATPADIAVRSWKQTWPRYVRVHHAEFVSGSMRNGVSLGELMDALKAQAFAATQRNATRRTGNTDPRKAYRQQAAVKLSSGGARWLRDRLEAAFTRHGKVTPAQLGSLDWPSVPIVGRGGGL
jgi:hypothetical protein